MTQSLRRCAAWLITAWLLVLCAPLLAEWIGPHNGPTLALVSLPWNPLRDIQSSVMALFRALVLGAMAALLVEPAKWETRNIGKFAYAILILDQILLITDMLRAYTVDWWIWSLSALGLVKLGVGDWRQRTFPIPSPWVSLLASLLTIITLNRWS